MIRIILALSILTLVSGANASVKSAPKKRTAPSSSDRVVITLLKPSLYNVQWKMLRLSKTGELQPGSIRFINMNGEMKTKKVPSGLAIAIENDALKVIWDLKFQLTGRSNQKCVPVAEIALPTSKERITICEQSIRQFGMSADLVQKLNRLQPKI